MTDQTTYRQKIRNEKEEIDLVQMIQYVLQKWKILLLAGVVGLLLGGAFGAMKTGKEPAQMDINDQLTREEVLACALGGSFSNAAIAGKGGVRDE